VHCSRQLSGSKHHTARLGVSGEHSRQDFRSGPERTWPARPRSTAVGGIPDTGRRLAGGSSAAKGMSRTGQLQPHRPARPQNFGMNCDLGDILEQRCERDGQRTCERRDRTQRLAKRHARVANRRARCLPRWSGGNAACLPSLRHRAADHSSVASGPPTAVWPWLESARLHGALACDGTAAGELR
jgi:hypothetical protein